MLPMFASMFAGAAGGSGGGGGSTYGGPQGGDSVSVDTDQTVGGGSMSQGTSGMALVAVAALVLVVVLFAGRR